MSFRLKLVAYFLLVSLLPLGAAAWRVHLGSLVRLRGGDSLFVLGDNRIVSGPRALAHVLVLLPLGPDTGRLAGSSYRALATPSQGQSSTKLAILSPQRGIDNAV